MAVIPLQQPIRWGYDPDTKELVLELRKEHDEADPEPADWIPDKEYAVRIPIANATAKDLSKDKAK